MKQDIVCGMEVAEGTEHTTLHGGRKMYFCSKDCQQKFIHKPDEYLKKGARPAAGPEKGKKAA